LSREKYVNTNSKQKSINQKKNISHPENPDTSTLWNSYSLPKDFPSPTAGERGGEGKVLLAIAIKIEAVKINFLNPGWFYLRKRFTIL
jgi:hypothetical protein